MTQPEPVYDLLVIGGGVNGCGIARDAAGRGLSVYLCEQSDLAAGTSSASTKLIHGGLRYLEHREFRLVREALQEREVLLAAAPHIIWPLRFVLPLHQQQRPRWLLRLGLLIYDSLGGRKRLPGTRYVGLAGTALGAPLKAEIRGGYEYSDCWVQDSRLVVLNAMDAAARGAVIHTRTRCTSARRDGAIWRMTVIGPGAAERTVSGRALINAAGPWVGEVLQRQLALRSDSRARLVKGSHIVVRRLYEHDRAYILQNCDRRIVFAIPYEREFTLIGTTDLDYNGDPGNVAIEPNEVAYLCRSLTPYFTAPPTPQDVVWSYSGVRPLYDDHASAASETTRDYVLDVDAPPGEVPLISVFGGKITTFRRLSEAVLARLSEFLDVAAPWTHNASLPGGDFAPETFDAQVAALRESYPFLSPQHVWRLMRNYGTRARQLLGDAQSVDDLGQPFGADLTEAEVRYLVEHEWARTAEDVLWRRSKLGLRIGPAGVAALEAFMSNQGVR
jgi:glycerol-3-phosphate dehydrogenase